MSFARSSRIIRSRSTRKRISPRLWRGGRSMVTEQRLTGWKFMEAIAPILGIDPSHVTKITIEVEFDRLVEVTIKEFGTEKLRTFFLKYAAEEKFQPDDQPPLET